MNNQAEYELYKRIKVLSEGNNGKTYLVEFIKDKSLWVSKYLDLATMTNQEKDEALREAKILEILSHPNIVKFREVYKTIKEKLCIVMEYTDEANGKYLPEAQILDWFTQICLAVKHVHDRKIIHRDLQGQNIFLNKNGQIKLGDFGISKIYEKSQENSKTFIGKLEYISPELINSQPYSFMTDIWSLGVVLYELCALTVPFNGDSLFALCQNIVNGNYKPISANYSYQLKELIQQMLQVDYQKRPTIHEILQKSVIRNRIKNFLTETIQRKEFSHTAFHNKVFDVKGDLSQVNLILNELPCPPQLLEQNAKNLQKYQQIIKINSAKEIDVISSPQKPKQSQPLACRQSSQPRTPPVQKQKPKSQIVQYTPKSLRTKSSNRKIQEQKVKIEQKVSLPVDKKGEIQQQKYQQFEQQPQGERIKQQQQQQQEQLEKQMKGQKQTQQKQNLESQPSQKSSQIDKKQQKSQQQNISKDDQKYLQDLDLMIKELEDLMNDVHYENDQFPNQENVKNYIFANVIEQREDDEEEPIEQAEQISTLEEEYLDFLNKQDQKLSILKIKLENALGSERMKKAINILQSTLKKMDFNLMEEQYGTNFEKLLPFLTLEERNKYAPLLFAYIIIE